MRSEITFPRQHARTQRFTLGVPRAFTITGGAGGSGTTVLFLRSRSGDDRTTCLWAYEPGSGERIVADPAVLLGGAEEHLSAEERARRERSREGSAGVVGYAVDKAGTVAAFTLSGRLFAADLAAGTVAELDTPGPVIDPRPAPDGRLIAYTAGGELRVIGTDGTGDRALATPENPEITWGVAEFIAAEEMQRFRGYWWSPDGTALIAARVDNAPVDRWWIADPANPASAPQEIAYPAAGTPNADVTLFAFAAASGDRTELTWDRKEFPYVVNVSWSASGAPLLVVQTRDQRTERVLTANTATGETAEQHTSQDPVWHDIIPGAPAWTPNGTLLRVEDADGARRVSVDGRALTDAQLHIRSVVDITATDVLVTASAGTAAEDPETGEIHVYRVTADGAERVSTTPGVHNAIRSGATTILVSSSLDRFGPKVTVLQDGAVVGEIASYAETPVLTAEVELTTAGPNRIPCAILLPSGFDPTSGEKLPVLMDPYGGPHGQRVVAARNPHLTSQWFADQGFAVIVADGRGTPHYSPEWEKAIVDDFAGATLDDQIEALQSLAVDRSYLDLTRVGIRGWSYGGYLAALAILRRPDVFHAGVSGAPVTDWHLYDTHYTERYLGHPAEQPEVYKANSLCLGGELGEAAEQVNPLMIIHGLADDNVVAAHTLRLSSALLAAGRPHEVLPLSGVTHMTPQEEVAENLLLLQVDFLKRSLTA
ncbi:S9 family peptidase [Yinghuangia soli]|uniref:Prolyl oligopeptidase family serine peptidase n=1 Tax=Yinghuangia soli TaxID=2908204 RepID=A0AA41U3P3_9ACTN|nr:prolyl oligopeptidase family serine peptidase [Yinghuangia soli]MCF2532948.1 prolyl oligopeptidase family serine peptidase [Yinghuangia soli]